MSPLKRRNSKEECDAIKNSNTDDTIDVPPLPILNVSTFTIIGSPEIDMLDTDNRLMRWTCMYRATLSSKAESAFMSSPTIVIQLGWRWPFCLIDGLDNDGIAATGGWGWRPKKS